MKIEEKLAELLIGKNLTISTVESCTGGLLSSRLTDVSGSSQFITLNMVTYANEAKENILGVKITSEGVVSEDCAYQMAKGLFELNSSIIFLIPSSVFFKPFFKNSSLFLIFFIAK